MTKNLWWILLLNNVEMENGVKIPVRKAAGKANDALKKFAWRKENSKHAS